MRGRAHRAMKARVFSEEAYCYLCGGPGREDDQLEHVIGPSAGGGNERGNFRRAHAECNRAKAARESAAARRR